MHFESRGSAEHAASISAIPAALTPRKVLNAHAYAYTEPLLVQRCDGVQDERGPQERCGSDVGLDSLQSEGRSAPPCWQQVVHLPQL